MKKINKIKEKFKRIILRIEIKIYLNNYNIFNNNIKVLI